MYPVSIEICRFDTSSIIQKHVCRSNGTPNCCPVKSCLLHVVSGIDTAPVLKKKNPAKI